MAASLTATIASQISDLALSDVIIVAILTLVGTVIVARIGRTPYAALADRVLALEKAVESARREVEALRAHDRAHAAVLQTHAGWDARALAAIPPEAAAGLGEPPPLYPPETH